MMIPCIRYADPRAALEWLTRAFGLTPLYVDERPDGTVGHVELAYDGGVVMLGGTENDRWPVRTPAQLGAATASIYIPVDDADAHHARAVAAGATILFELADTTYGSREYTARDPEGHLWGFGTYRPAITPPERQPNGV